MASAAAPITQFEIPEREAPAPVKEEPKGPTLEQRLESMERELHETKESAKVWEAIANNRGSAPTKPETEDKPGDVLEGYDFGKDEDEEDKPLEGDTPEAMLDELTKLGGEALAKRGFVRKSDVIKLVRAEARKAAATAATQAVGRARQQLTVEEQIMQDFPELKDRNSELFKATSEHVQAAVALDKSAAKNPATLYLAARAAKAQLTAKGNQGHDDDDEEPPAPRRRPSARDDHDEHVRAQQGDRGRNRSRIDGGDGEIQLTDEQSELARRMGLTDDEYKAHAAKPRQAARGRR